MSIFDILTLFGGLAMFLYGMRLMGDGLKEGSSGALKRAMESVTNNAFKAFLLGVVITAVIQSSTATIVITSGLVGAGIISLRQSLGIIIGANVGTTVTGQIIRLLDINSDSAAWLQIFKPSTLAPIALILGIIFIMGVKVKNAKTIGGISIGFGVLFTGLLTMTGAVDNLAETGAFEKIFSSLGSNPLIGYFSGAGVSFMLQSSSAAIGILQALSSSGDLMFKSIYAVIVGIYLGDCVTTAIVCSIGARAEARRVGAVNILFNLSKSVLVFVGVTLLKYAGLLDWIWDKTATSGIIANTNTMFNLSCALLLLPMLPVYERLSRKIIKDDPVSENKYKDKMDALSPVFFSTPALALNRCYDALMVMFQVARQNIERGVLLLRNFDEKTFEDTKAEEDNIDIMADAVSEYLVDLSAHLSSDEHVAILNHYYKIVTEFERLGDHGMNIAETAAEIHKEGTPFSEAALEEVDLLYELINRILGHTEQAFAKRDEEAAYMIEPLEEVVDDMVVALRNNHLQRLSKGECNVFAGTDFMDLLGDMERISDICSNIGLATVTRVHPELANKTHDYTYLLHSGRDEKFNHEYAAAHEEFFARLAEQLAAQVGKPL